MKGFHALIPAALLAGTVFSVPVEAKITEDAALHAERVSAKKKLFKSNAVKRPGKTSKETETRKAPTAKGKTANLKRKTASETVKTASVKPRKATSETVKTASVKPRKAASETAKTASLKPRKSVGETVKTASLKPRRLVAAKKRKPVQVAAQAEIEKPQIALIGPMSLTKVLRSGPREMRKTAPDPQFVVAGRALSADAGGEMQVTELIRELAPSHGVPTWFALRIANVESNYNPDARGRAGEIGVYQLKCQTARGMGFAGDCAALTDARTNVRWGLKHLSLAIASAGGNLRLAASKHNGGLGRKSLVHSYIAKVF